MAGRRSIRRKKSAARAGVRAGTRDGYLRGWRDGYRIGASQAIARQLPLPTPTRRPLKVLFVRENSTGYHLIERGIISALSKAVEQVAVAQTLDPVEAIAERERPDLMLVLNGIFVLQPDRLERIRAMGIRTCAWYADDPYFMELSAPLAPHYDHVFTHEIGTVEYYRSLGAKAHYLPFAAPLEHAGPMRVGQRYWTDICFIGSGFPNRIAFFDRLAPYLKKKKVFIAGGLWNQLKAYRDLKRAIHLPGVQVDEALQYYNGAKIVINLHRTHEPPGGSSYPVVPHSVNPRTFEINACCTLQLTDARSDLAAMYAPGLEIETFASPGECIEKMEYYLRREDERLDKALRAYERTRRSHSYEQRIAVMLDTIFGAHG